ncbi:sensor domain-containing diguanylate cyclase [Marinobacter sp. G11]|uniref:sensor domain-containing diguanylate cyclase n=1 Tax=Marinobacter sp. G11 TaxID=2903522 RepID=UPI001E5D8DC6
MGFRWLEVPDDSLNIDGVRSLLQDRWQAHEADTVLNLGFSDGTFWLRVEVPPEPRNRLLQVGYPLLDEVSVYWEQAGNIVETWHTGDTLPFRSRPIEHRTFVFLVPSNTEPVTAWVRVKTQGSIQIPVKVTPSAEFLAYEQIAYGWQAMFVGVVVALALYNLFLFAIVRYPTYLWYVLTVLSAGLVQLNFNGLLFQWFWPDLPVVKQYLTAVMVPLGLSLALVFTMKFLSVRQYSRGAYRLLQVLLMACLFAIGYGLLGSYQCAIALISTLAAFVTAAAWAVGVLVWRRGQVLAGFYVVAWTPLLIAHLLLALAKLGLIPSNRAIEVAPQVGVAIEVVVLSLALAYRINLERRRRQEAQEHALDIQREANLMLETRVRERTEELEQANDQLRSMSLTDGLTRVANRRRFDDKLDIEWNRAMRHDQELSLLMLDIDHFKKVNDSFGHLVGDDCLVSLAATLQGEILRASDLVARYGGEEFAVLLPATDGEGARQVAERMRQAVAGKPVPSGQGGTPVELTISVGVATMRPAIGAGSQELVRRADEALYAAKTNGRNRVEVWRDEAVAPADRG